MYIQNYTFNNLLLIFNLIGFFPFGNSSNWLNIVRDFGFRVHELI